MSSFFGFGRSIVYALNNIKRRYSTSNSSVTPSANSSSTPSEKASFEPSKLIIIINYGNTPCIS